MSGEFLACPTADAGSPQIEGVGQGGPGGRWGQEAADEGMASLGECGNGLGRPLFDLKTGTLADEVVEVASELVEETAVDEDNEGACILFPALPDVVGHKVGGHGDLAESPTRKALRHATVCLAGIEQ